jgi:aryl-alcohol dehydrogenase-like predicted oxidoreductase
MIYGSIPGIDKPVSRIAQGTTMIGTANLEASMALLDAALAAGINTFDSAHVYAGGDCERALGQWVRRRGVRDRIVLLDKGAHLNADRNRVTPFDIACDVHDSLARLQFDYIDLYVLHRDDPAVEVGPIVESLNEHRAAGRIRAFGGSNWTYQRVEQANEYAYKRGLTPFAVSSPHFSLGEMVQPPWGGCLSVAGPQGQAARTWYADHKMPLFAWSSLCHGLLSGKHTRQSFPAQPKGDTELMIRAFRSPANLDRLDRVLELARTRGLAPTQVVLAWILNQPVTVHPLVGSETPDEARTNAAAAEVKLSAQEMAWLEPQSGI